MKTRAAEESKEWPQILALVTASFSGFSAGNLFAWPSPGIPKLLTDDYDFDIEAASYLTVIPPLAMILSSPLYSALLNKIGRKYTLLSCSLLHLTSWLMIAFGRETYVFYISRALVGMGDACIFAVLPTYIAEVTTPKVRGVWSNMMVFMIFLGQFMVNVVGFYCTIRTTALIMLAFPVVFGLTFSFMPETPYYLIMKGNVEAARKSLWCLRRAEDIESEFRQLTQDVQRQMSEPGTFKDLFAIESNRKAVVIANLARIIQQLSGISSFIVYTQYIFLQAGGDISSGHASMIFGGLLVVLNTFANFISDKMGKNRSMVVSCFGSGMALLGEAIYFYLKENTDLNLEYVNWFPLFGLVLYVLVFSVGLAMVPTLLLGELFSTSIRSKAAITTNIVFGVLICVATKLFQVLMSGFGMWVPFLFFCVCCFTGGVVSYYIIPDTRGKTLEQIQQMLKGCHEEKNTH